MDRTILHCDMDNFFASVECLDYPEIRHLPVAVCGDAEMRHGVVLAKNDVAKSYQIKTGESIFSAQKKCPHLYILSPNFDKYRNFSNRAKEIYYSYTNLCEEYSIDECFLDVTGSQKLFGDGESIARQIKERIKQELGITVSIGVSYNKFFAKMGSDYKKPDSVTVITEKNYKEILWKLPLTRMLFIGDASAKLLYHIGIKTIGDLGAASADVLFQILGKNGPYLKSLANGQDRSVVSDFQHISIPKSLSQCITPSHNICSNDEMKKVLLTLAQNVAKRLRSQAFKAGELSLKIRDPFFHEVSHQIKFLIPTQLWHDIFASAYQIYLSRFSHIREIRAVTLRLGALKSTSEEALPLCFEESENNHFNRLEETIDNIQSRFGTHIIQNGIQFTHPDLRLRK